MENERNVARRGNGKSEYPRARTNRNRRRRVAGRRDRQGPSMKDSVSAAEDEERVWSGATARDEIGRRDRWFVEPVCDVENVVTGGGE